MHYEWLDAYLLSFPGVEKDYQPVWQWFRYKVRGRLFAAVCSPGPEYKIYGGHDLVNLKCGAAEGELLRARYPDSLPGCYSDKRTWISCLLDGELPEEVLRDLCGRSYALAVEKLPKYVRRELAETEAAKAAQAEEIAAAQALEEGQFSGVVEADDGFYLILRKPVDLEAVAPDYFDALLQAAADSADISTTRTYADLDVSRFYDELIAARAELDASGGEVA